MAWCWKKPLDLQSVWGAQMVLLHLHANGGTQNLREEAGPIRITETYSRALEESGVGLIAAYFNKLE